MTRQPPPLRHEESSPMRRTTLARTIAAAAAVAAVTSVGAAYATEAPAPEEIDTTTVVNKSGHEVDEHAAQGQQRAADARAKHETSEEPAGEPTAEPTTDSSDDAADVEDGAGAADSEGSEDETAG